MASSSVLRAAVVLLPIVTAVRFTVFANYNRRTQLDTVNATTDSAMYQDPTVPNCIDYQQLRGQYQCAAQHRYEEIQRNLRFFTWKQTLLAEVWACLAASCRCGQVSQALQTVKSDPHLPRVNVTEDGLPVIDCGAAMADYEAKAAKAERMCANYARGNNPGEPACTASQTYENAKREVQREMGAQEAMAARLDQRDAKREEKREIEAKTESRKEAAANKCAPEFVKTDLFAANKDRLKQCVATACRALAAVDRRMGEVQPDMQKCAKEGFERALRKVRELKQEKADRDARLKALYNKN